MRIFLKPITLIMIIFVSFFIQGCSNNTSVSEENAEIAYDGLLPQHTPYGQGNGIYPGRVVWIYDNKSVEWNGEGYWWNISNFDESVINEMVDQGLESLTGTNSPKKSWEKIFTYHNDQFNNGGGYQRGEKIAIKVNLNGSGVDDDSTSGETNLAYVNPVLLKVLLESLVSNNDIDPADITVYDVSRIFPDYLVNYCSEGELKGIRFVGRNNAVPDLNEPIEWSNDFVTVTSYLPTCLTESDYLINLADLKGHSYGITLTGKNLFGSFLNDSSMRPPEYANLHHFLNEGKMGDYNPITDLMAHEQVYSKTCLYLLNALITAPSEGKEITKENATFRSEPFNGSYASSILLSQDAVAIDSVGLDILVNEPTILEFNPITGTNLAEENYLHEASQLANAPSGTVYQNNKNSLGVHEHRNNNTELLYSRNLGFDEGIELVYKNLSDE